MPDDTPTIGLRVADTLAAALEADRAHPLRVWVLENGYFRPDWITVEENGVNASSGLPRDRGCTRYR